MEFTVGLKRKDRVRILRRVLQSLEDLPVGCHTFSWKACEKAFRQYFQPQILNDWRSVSSLNYLYAAAIDYVGTLSVLGENSTVYEDVVYRKRRLEDDTETRKRFNM